MALTQLSVLTLTGNHRIGFGFAAQGSVARAQH
jgi:hypothetical protein